MPYYYWNNQEKHQYHSLNQTYANVHDHSRCNMFYQKYESNLYWVSYLSAIRMDRTTFLFILGKEKKKKKKGLGQQCKIRPSFWDCKFLG